MANPTQAPYSATIVLALDSPLAFSTLKINVSVAQSCPVLCDPMNYIVCQSPPSVEFSRQEYWSG